jgi:hypothetical protein
MLSSGHRVKSVCIWIASIARELFQGGCFLQGMMWMIAFVRGWMHVLVVTLVLLLIVIVILYPTVCHSVRDSLSAILPAPTPTTAARAPAPTPTPDVNAQFIFMNTGLVRLIPLFFVIALLDFFISLFSPRSPLYWSYVVIGWHGISSAPSLLWGWVCALFGVAVTHWIITFVLPGVSIVVCVLVALHDVWLPVIVHRPWALLRHMWEVFTA